MKVAKRLEICFGGCEKMLGGVCILRGSPCTYFERWIEFLAFATLPCPHFKERIAR